MMRIAVQGCCHGQLDAIYNRISSLELRNNYTVDLLLICGDFQAVRNCRDLQCMAVPNKYKQLGDFHKYYTGERKAPILTIVIGGNHEASNYMWELYHGGWLAPNIYFLGYAGCVQVDGVRIAGASGIYKHHDFRLGHHEKLPYNSSTLRSIYHIREYNVRRLSLLSSPTIFLSHDWPQSIEHYGDLQGLLRRKKFLRDSVNSSQLGSPPLMGLLQTLQPHWWFAAHLHTRFEATVVHSDPTALYNLEPPNPTQSFNPDEILIEDYNFEDTRMESSISKPDKTLPWESRIPDEVTLIAEEVAAPPRLPPRKTKFLALDKCLPNRQYLEIIEVPSVRDSTHSEKYIPSLAFDPEWLAITRAFNPMLSTTAQQLPFPNEADAKAMVQRELDWVSKYITGMDPGKRKLVEECQQFVSVAPVESEEATKYQQPPWYPNPQTDAFCAMLGVENKINPPPTAGAGPMLSNQPLSS